MRKENYVSIWIGNVISSELLDEYVLTRYSDDGDDLGSSFSYDFSIGYIDDDFREVDFFSLTNEFDLILNDFSYGDRIVSELPSEILKLPEKVNSAILLYNFKYDGKKLELYDLEKKIRFFATVPYR